MNQKLWLLIVEKYPTNIDRIIYPDFGSAGKSHDWRNYIPLEVRDLWDKLDIDGQILVFYLAQQLADTENWD